MTEQNNGRTEKVKMTLPKGLWAILLLYGLPLILAAYIIFDFYTRTISADYQPAIDYTRAVLLSSIPLVPGIILTCCGVLIYRMERKKSIQLRPMPEYKLLGPLSMVLAFLAVGPYFLFIQEWIFPFAFCSSMAMITGVLSYSYDRDKTGVLGAIWGGFEFITLLYFIYLSYQLSG
ncbi:MAG: hypothetical protein HZB92_08760 [Euryarchaeota archaeon]|nr:hypothetical protein [Euryarchaeota archaeon]